jgi:ribosomal protein L12E/L44/L45/RPP1/RPP2
MGWIDELMESIPETPAPAAPTTAPGPASTAAAAAAAPEKNRLHTYDAEFIKKYGEKK